ncbi:MAG: response regulator transcription factor [Sandaracinaceae bacterium]|nr:response regulator transcription factor [Sandaracinaceae bacterium]
MRILVVDDEPIARARLVRLLGRIEGAEVAGEASTGAEALELVDRLRPDALLLDIDMPGLDGLAVAERPGIPPVIFTTAHQQFALEAFEANAYDYLLKPVAKERLERGLARVAARAAVAPADPEPWRLVVSDGALKRFVDARAIDAFTSDQKYVAFRVDGEEVLTRESLDALEARLGPLGFVRANRGALVRREAITAYDTAAGEVVLSGGDRVPVSRRAAPAVRAALGLG